MPGIDILEKKISALDGKDYAGYQSLKGTYHFPDFDLILHQIPKDPYAPPHTGVYCIQIARDQNHVVDTNTTSKVRETALRDFLSRRFYEISQRVAGGRRGTGYSGIITITPPGQAILDRNSVVFKDTVLEIRCFIGLPATGRIIDAGTAVTMLIRELPEIVCLAAFSDNLDKNEISRQLDIAEDAEFLRNELRKNGFVSFIANDAVLPRESGSSDKPLQTKDTISFLAPEERRTEFNLPHSGSICGMAIPEGITLIVGGGYHGKSTLLHAIEQGIYNHIPGDGRSFCVSVPETVKIRAYSGRPVVKDNISSFIKNLPFQQNTTAFSTENASGSTSQAAGIVEAIEIGATVLLMDEDTCATNFMIRDYKMQQLVRKEDEPITTFIDRVRHLYADKKISTVLVLGGAGDYFEVADCVIQMKNYLPFDVTEKAHEIARNAPAKRMQESASSTFEITPRIPLADSISALNEYGKKGIFARETKRLNFGKNSVDLTDLEQLLEIAQTRAIGFAMEYAVKYMDGETTLREIINRIFKDIDNNGLDIISDRLNGNFARFRPFELAMTINRLRGFDVRQGKS